MDSFSFNRLANLSFRCENHSSQDSIIFIINYSDNLKRKTTIPLNSCSHIYSLWARKCLQPKTSEWGEYLLHILFIDNIDKGFTLFNWQTSDKRKENYYTNNYKYYFIISSRIYRLYFYIQNTVHTKALGIQKQL